VNLAGQLNMAATEILPSRLLPEVLEQVAGIPRIMVLDAGIATPESVEYFGHKSCRLQFSSFHDVLLDPPKPAPVAKVGQIIDEKERLEYLYHAWRDKFKALMNYQAGTRFDLCLFWDYFNYLDDIALKAFAETLAPFIGSHTVGHCFAMLKPETVFPDRTYGILTPGEIAARPVHHGLPGAAKIYARHARPQARLISLLTGFVVNHGVLRRDGMLEATLKAG
jgi:hypothetical protein